MLQRNPSIYEINTWVWLHELTIRYGEPITLANVPDEVISELASWKFDAIWMMGIWKRSPGGRKIALEHPGLQHEYSLALPDFSAGDVVGSPYAVHQYAVAPEFGGRDALAAFRAQLAQSGIRLILDYVPNHVAVDHHWLVDAPEALVRGTESDLSTRPGYYFQDPSGYIFAHGRDPYFPAWTDTAQVDAFSPVFRDRARELLLDIAQQCDGVRCDMAMLLVNRIFAQTWHHSDLPETEFWPELIAAVKEQHPNFTFIGEIYWEMEGEMIDLGFDYAYDKRLYDRLRDHGADMVRDHLLAGLDYQQHMVRFVENHDEKRAADAFNVREYAAAALSTLLPGAKLIHEGQIEGRRMKLPVQLGRRTVEPVNEAMKTFYRKLFEEVAAPIYHKGTYLALSANPILANDAGRNAIVAFAWSDGTDWRVVVSNYSGETVAARIMIPNPAWNGAYPRTFADVFSGTATQIKGDELLTAGFPVQIGPYGIQVFRIIE